MPVVDASVAFDWVAPDADPHGPAAAVLRRLAAAGEPLSAPRLLVEEVANGLLTGIRRGRWEGHEADQAFDWLQRLPVGLVDTDADRVQAWELARRHDQHPVHDMIYVALARRLGQPLLTADARLATRLPDDWTEIVG